MSRIRLTIDQLVLKGIDGADRHALVDGLKGELSKVLADPATRAEWARTRRTPVLRLGKMPLESGSSGSRRMGAQIARAIGKGLKP
jgi:hypothetical protein